MRRKIILGLLLLFLFMGINFAKSGIKGEVSDKKTNEPLIGATVFVTGTTKGTITDFDGNFNLELDPGKYNITIQFVSYEPVQREIEIKSDEFTELNIALEEAVTQLESVEIIAKKNREAENLLMIEQKNADIQVETIGAMELSRKGAGDVAAGIKKVTGVSMMGSKNLFVRGLGDRYNGVQLNGMPLISPDPLKKVIKLDIFQAELVKVLEVNKVLSAKNFADYTGALINIETKDYPEESFFNVSVGAKYNENATFNDFYRIEADGLRYFSLDVNERKDFTPEKYLKLNRLMEINDDFKYGSFDYDIEDGLPNISAGISGGTIKELKDNKKIGFLGSVTFDNGYSFYDDVININTNRQNNQKARFFNDQYIYNTLLAGFANLTYLNGSKSKIKYNFMFLNNGEDDFKLKSGKDEDWGEGNYLTRVAIYSNYRLINNQLNGEYSLKEDISDITWNLGLANAFYSVPDRREIVFRVDETPRSFLTLNNGNDTKRIVVDQNTNTLTGGINFIRNLKEENGKITFGTDFLLGNLKYDSYMFGYVFKPDQEILEANINVENIDPFFNTSIVLENVKSNSNDNMGYNGQRGVFAAYVDYTYDLNNSLTFNIGLRSEYSTMSIISLTLDEENNNQKEHVFDDVDLFPAFNLKYKVSEYSNIRYAVSRTVTRPSFFEKTPAQLVPEPGQYTTAGTPTTKETASINEPHLENSYSINTDVKYELFPHPGELVSLTLYGKIINEPIESVSILKGGTDITYTFKNFSENAYATGAEFEFKKRFSNLYSGLNTSYIYTLVNVPEEENENATRRPLQGASPYLVNADIAYKFSYGGSDQFSTYFGIIFNIYGKRLYRVGVSGAGNQYELPFEAMDLVLKNEISKNIEINLSVENILNAGHTIVQDVYEDPTRDQATREVVIEEYFPGVVYGLNLRYKF